MKQLTIEELKALEVGDWVWVVENNKSKGTYFAKCFDSKTCTPKTAAHFCEYDGFPCCLAYSDYGKTWLAYKNKEQAEEQEHCVICHMPLSNILPKVDKYGNKYCNGCYEAKCTLENLKEKRTKGKIVELPCKIGDTIYYVEYFCKYKGCSADTQTYCCGCEEMIERERKHEKYVIAEKKFALTDFSQIGKKYFTDKSEAERRIAELKGEKK